jgi:hypothetical protein
MAQKVGERVRTAPSVRPKRYANRTAVVREVAHLGHGYLEVALWLDHEEQPTWFTPAELEPLPQPPGSP